MLMRTRDLFPEEISDFPDGVPGRNVARGVPREFTHRATTYSTAGENKDFEM